LPNNSQTNYMGTSGTQTIQIVLWVIHLQK
jgi:hypothetical protein